MWREKARMLRERANEASDPLQESTLLTLANDCDELAADLEKMGALLKSKRRRRPDRLGVAARNVSTIAQRTFTV
jgi:hypothetical protein